MSNPTHPVLYAVEGTTTRITLNRPEKRNALNDAVIAGVKNALREAAADDNVRAAVLSGAGNDFCSGADLEALQKIAEASIVENTADARSLMELFLLIRAVKVPVIAAVKGRALAGGCGLASACDIVLAAESARFGYPEVKLGFVPAMVAAIVRRNASEKHAFELLTNGREISASEARDYGFVNHVFSDESFDEEVTKFAESFAKVSKSAVALTKSLLYQIDGFAFNDALETGADVNVIARMTEDCKQGIEKFLKRKS